MPVTLLLDLDDTLLDSNMDSFIPAYFQALSGFLSERVQPDVMLPALIAGTRKMMANTDPGRTLQQTFDAEFFPAIGFSRDELQPRIDRFYEEVFPDLRGLTRPRPQAVELVEWALEQGYHLAIATNPLFPLAAIYHRMRWAGLAPEDYPFGVVSAYESFHFTKPHPAYFAEVLARMSWPDGSVLMVGDDVERDLHGSSKLGLPVFWISTPEAISPDGVDLTGRGSIADLRPWLEAHDLATLEPAFSSPDSLQALMLSSPASMSWVREQAEASALKRRPLPNEWSLTEIICHLRDTEQEVNLPRLRLLLDRDEPFIVAPDTDSWAEERGYNNQDECQALRDFTIARLETLQILGAISATEWQRKARHAIFGPTNLLEQVEFMAEHDRLHIRQALTTLQQV